MLASVDVVARVVAVIGLLLGVVTATVAVLTYRRDRHRVSVTLQPLNTLRETQDGSYERRDVVRVVVVSLGRDLSVEQIKFEWADAHPAPTQLAWAPARMEETGFPPGAVFTMTNFGWEIPSLPVTLTAGVSRSFGFVVDNRDPAWVHPPSDKPFPPGVQLRAAVTTSDGRTHRSAPAEMHLGLYDVVSLPSGGSLTKALSSLAPQPDLGAVSQVQPAPTPAPGADPGDNHRHPIGAEDASHEVEQSENDPRG